MAKAEIPLTELLTFLADMRDLLGELAMRPTLSGDTAIRCGTARASCVTLLQAIPIPVPPPRLGSVGTGFDGTGEEGRPHGGGFDVSGGSAT